MKRILVIDDEPNVRTVLKMLLEDDGYEVLTAENGEKGMAAINEGPELDLVISDLKMPGIDGLELLRHVKQAGRSLPLVMITAYGSIEKAVEAMKSGAADFITKPFNKDVIRHIVHKLLTTEDLKRENDLLRQACPVPGVIAHSPSMREVVELVEKVAAAPSAVLILGESGTGKEVIARAIHARAVEKKKSDFSVPFVSINCPAVPDTLIESELFGYRKGAFTGASQNFSGKLSQARGGVLFLDEIAEIPLPTQAKLLRFIEEKVFEPLGSTVKTRVDARIICATNKDLESLVREGKFREDLYYRINTITIRIPALRERREDILPLARHFLDQYSLVLGKQVRGFTQEAEGALCGYSWPGNVRELRNVIERAVVLSVRERISADCLPRQMLAAPSAGAVTGDNKLEQVEKTMLLEVMRQSAGNVSKAARELGISRDTLRYRIRKYNIPAG
ncbi:MAG TPA: sigma-54 dependent transcriptional regulator [Spirochaetia bacterium]|nr:sigma-54 dependent transcriptional regulator [Spirochaetia bacterium]